MAKPYGYEIEPPPERFTGTSVLTRIVDGLAFRYFWATEGLRGEDFAFRPGADSMSMVELLQHVLHLVFMLKQLAFDSRERELVETDDPAALRRLTLENLEAVRAQITGLDDEALATHQVLRRSGKLYPVWNIMNGPLSDALTHVGQINAWRRLSGNPTQKVDVFEGGRV